MNYKRNAKYFKKVNFLSGIIFIIIGIISCSIDGVGIMPGLALIAFGILFIILQIKNKPTDEEIDLQAQEPLGNLKDKALAKHGISEDQVNAIEPILLGGYINSSIETATETLLAGGLKSAAQQFGNILKTNLKEEMQEKIGKDGIARTSLCEWTLLLFSSEQVFSYTLRFSLLTEINNESTDEYFYQDFVSVSTESTNTGFHYLKMVTANGKTKSIPINEADEQIMKSVNALKQMIRNKRK